jgi:hypothetical protein
MQQKPAYELFGLQCHGLLLGVVAVVLVAERHLGLGDVQQTIIG